MEDFCGAAGRSGPDGRRVTIDEGRLAGLFCRLHRERFTGLLQVHSGEHDAAIGFRAGNPVSFADPTQAHTLGEELVERGQLTRAQYSTVIARVTDVLVDDETLAFCEHAVALGYLAEAEMAVELSERIRARLIQVQDWRDCEIEMDASADALSGHGEFPQEIGALVYMGVRTFYDEADLRDCLPEPTDSYLRLLASPASIAHFFGLDDDEFRLLRRMESESAVRSLLKSSQLERTHVLALLVLLHMAEFCEFSNAPFAQQPDPERSGARPNPARHSAPPHTRSTVNAPSVTPSARPQAPSARPQAPSARPVPAPLSATAEPASFQAAKTASPQPTKIDATQEALLEAAARAAKTRKSSSTMRRVLPDAQPSSPQSAPEPARQVISPSVKQRLASRPLTGPLPGTSAESPRNAEPTDPNQRTEYTKAHLNELIQRRKQVATGDGATATGKREPLRDLRYAREMLREQHFSRAEDVLRALLQQDPQNDVLRTYHLWSRLRAHPEIDDTHLGELTDLAKKLVQDPEHSAFATYMLGHLYLSAKKDELAEKYFRRAHAADRSNKDAERHLLILERRKQVAADADAAANRKIFGITIANKPKP